MVSNVRSLEYLNAFPREGIGNRLISCHMAVPPIGPINALNVYLQSPKHLRKGIFSQGFIICIPSRSGKLVDKKKLKN